MRLVLGLLVFAVACGGSDPISPAGERGIRIVDGAGVTDTVGALRSQALVVEIHDTTGALAPVGTIVRVNSLNVSLSSLDGGSFGTFLAKEVDASGRVAVLVRLGTVTGTGRVIVNVPIFGMIDTVEYTILPGNARRVQIAPADTLLSVARSFKYRGSVVDQYGNRREDPVVWTTDPGAAVSGDGTMTVSTTGRFRVTITATIGGSPTTATAMVSAVPNARIAAWRSPSIILMDLDGGNLRTLAPAVDGGIGAGAEWMPDRRGVVYSTLVGSRQTLTVADTSGSVRPFFATLLPNVTHQAEPRVTADGQWLIFGAYDTRCSAYCLYRSRIDGTGAELLSSTVSSGNPVFSPSPDGSRIAVWYGSGVRVFDVATRTLSTWNLPTATSPAWSPDGTKIAVIQSNGLALIAPDGSTIRNVPTSARNAIGRIAWLSDSRFLLARATNGFFDLIDTQTGAEIPLPFTNVIGALSVR